MLRSVVPIPVSLVLLSAACPAAITYQLIPDPGLTNGLTYSGSVTTDGSLGSFTDASPITSWTISLTSPFDTYLLTEANSSVNFSADQAPLSITVSQISIAPTGPGEGSTLSFSTPSSFQSITFRSAYTDLGPGNQSIRAGDAVSSSASSTYTYPTFGTLLVATVPEPSMAVFTAFSIGFLSLRRRRLTA